MSTYGYVRVSTGTQANEGHSLDAQHAKITRYCAAKDLPLTAVFCDAAVSAAKLRLGQRPQGAALFKALKPGDNVIVTKLDRAWRSAVDAMGIVAEWQKVGVNLHILDLGVDLSSPMGRFFFAVMAAFAELERDMISERTAIGLTQARATGIHTGRAPLGFKHDENGHLDPVFPDLFLAAALLRMRTEGIDWKARLTLLQAAGLTQTSTGLSWTKDRLDRATQVAVRNTALIDETLAEVGFVCAAWNGCTPRLSFRDAQGRTIDPALINPDGTSVR